MTTPEELRRLAELAGGDKWGHTPLGESWLNVFEDKSDKAVCVNAQDGAPPGAGAYIAAACPQTILALLDEMERLREALKKIAMLDDPNCAANSEYDKGLMIAHSATGTIARQALKGD